MATSLGHQNPFVLFNHEWVNSILFFTLHVIAAQKRKARDFQIPFLKTLIYFEY